MADQSNVSEGGSGHQGNRMSLNSGRRLMYPQIGEAEHSFGQTIAKAIGPVGLVGTDGVCHIRAFHE